ncbi:serine hydrolase [Phycicoccus sp. HDW14]|uniref:serine hydrolase n=1 Tax=Phycicoccus sp. HDW14 TaxID=2714941 RepID=UPI00140A92F0|nr:serine hydrolase [Phycicoccus sp. HDW14]QIM21627.1 serine hydrolase [Phycicoccus sp. HDW14]
MRDGDPVGDPVTQRHERRRGALDRADPLAATGRHCRRGAGARRARPHRRRPARRGSGGGGGAPAQGTGTGGLTSLTGNTRNQIVWAPLSNPSAVRTEGSVSRYKAWSTSKVLVVAAYLDTVVDGDPAKIPSGDRSLIRAALTRSDGDAVVAIRERIPGSPGAAITTVLRSIGDTATVAPDRSQGSMSWSPRQQVRFMAALAAGRVVSAKASSWLLGQMQPISAHRWGLGTIGASSFKGGWLTPESETRQMGIVGGYAVAIITVGEGPAVVQTDGDSAHVQQMNRLAALLAKRLG